MFKQKKLISQILKCYKVSIQYISICVFGIRQAKKKNFTNENIFLLNNSVYLINRFTFLFGRCSHDRFCRRHYSCSVCNRWSTLVTVVTVRRRHQRWHSPLPVTVSVWHNTMYSSGKPYYSGDRDREVRRSRIQVNKKNFLHLCKTQNNLA